MLEEIEESSDFIIIAMETDKDHLHLMIQYIPTAQLGNKWAFNPAIFSISQITLA
ncbi:transposase [Helicobacter suis]|uniref:transposase n=1 Tax=Helicobacter suis TaxID=104628 RepID=UPI003B983584